MRTDRLLYFCMGAFAASVGIVGLSLLLTAIAAKKGLDTIESNLSRIEHPCHKPFDPSEHVTYGPWNNTTTASY